MANRMPSGSVGIRTKDLHALCVLRWRRSLARLQAHLFDQRGGAMLAGFRLAIGPGNRCEFALYPIK
jgi:hypothetical protein